MPKSYKAIAPATMMLFGEHAVLHGSMSIVCALNRHIKVALTPRADNKINISTDTLGKYKCTINELELISPFQFVLSSIALYKQQLCYGFNLVIVADFAADLGLGSSAAVTVATVSVLEQWLKKEPKSRQLFQLAKQAMLKVQKVGSGADIAACVYNSVVAYKMKPLYIKKLITTLPLTIVYSGKKKPTVEVINQANILRQKHPKIFKTIYVAINNCTKQAIKAIKAEDWQKLGELMNIHHGLQDAIGTSNETLAELVYALRQFVSIYGAKISGSGLGDCVIGLGTIPNDIFPQNASQRKLGILQI